MKVPATAAETLRRSAASVAGGAVLALAFPPYGLPFLLPLGIALLVGALLGLTSVRRAFYLGLAAGTVFFGGTLFWLANVFGAAALSLCAILAVFIALFAAGFVWLRARLPARVPVPLLAAVLWTGIEYFRSELFALNFGWMGLGYAVVDHPALAIVASWVGSYGVSFLIVAFGSWIADAVFLPPRSRWLVAGSVLFFWTLLYAGRFGEPAVPARPLIVRAIQANADDEEAFSRLSRPNGKQAFDVLLWPEYSLLRDPAADPKLWDRLQNIARVHDCVFVFGAKDKTNLDPADEAAFRNTAFVLDSDGREAGRHVKNHTVHFIQDGIRGRDAHAVGTSAGRVGVAICFDMDYPDVARRLAQSGAEVFLVPNMDPAEWGPVQQAQHRQLFQMRAAECGRYLVRADVAGGTSACAPNGREIARVATNDETALTITVERETARTLFVRGGWRFGQACLATSIFLFAWGATVSRRAPPDV